MSAVAPRRTTLQRVADRLDPPVWKRSRALRLYRPVCVALAVVLLALFAAEIAYGWTSDLNWRAAAGNDLAIYTTATESLLRNGQWYLERQLHGPYPLLYGDVLYPPVTAFAFAPWIVLPFVVYLAIPIVVVAVLIATWRPAPWTWPVMAACLLYPMTPLKAIAGNPVLWMAMFLALGLRYRWPAALILLKPSLGPFALVGLRYRRWWMVAALIALGSLPFGSMSVLWPSVVVNAIGAGPLYSLNEVPMMLVPVAAWLGRRNDRERPLF
jgi:hypothetical protein